MNTRKFNILLLLFFISIGLCAQDKSYYTSKSSKAIKALEKGMHLHDNHQEWDAKDELLKAIKADAKFIEAHLILAEVEVDLMEYKEAIDEYKKAITINPDFEPRAFYGLAKTQMRIGNYEDAKENLKTFLQAAKISKVMKENAQAFLDNCDYAMWAVKHPVPFNPVNLGDSINSRHDEYFPSITADNQSFFFTRQIPRKSNSPLVDTIYDEDIYVSEKHDNTWGMAKSLGAPINTYRNEGAVCISADGQTMVFVACDRIEAQQSCDLYISWKLGTTWSNPLNMGPPINTKYGESQPCLSADGRTIYFVSDRPGGIGGHDIWKSTLGNDGYWTNPVNMGPKINSAKGESCPFIHEDNQTFYFSSNGRQGMGDYDIYMSRLDAKGEWGDPVNLGYPINTFGLENSLIVAADGKTAYIASNRKNGKGGLDFYSFELYPDARPFKVSYVKGKVFDKETSKPLEVRFELLDVSTGKIIMDAVSNKVSGDFLVCLPAGKEYALHASKDGYLFYSESFDLKTTGTKIDSVTKNVAMQPIKIGEKVILKNIFFETNKYDLKDESKAELKKLISFLSTNKSLHIEISGHTDNVGSKELNQTLSENRAKTVMNFIIAGGIDAARMSSKGYGDTQPIVANDTDEHRAMNRRTEFKIVQ